LKLNERTNIPKSLTSAYGPISMIVHAMACQPAKNAGALMAVNAIADAVPLIHGPMGCAALRKMNSFGVYSLFPHTPCTNLNELDLVYGAEERLKRGIVETYKRYHPALIVVIPTCPSDMIGDDIASAVRRAKREVGCEVLYSTGELIKGRPIGYHDVLCSLFDQLLPEDLEIKKIEGSVNLITFPIHSSDNKMDEMVQILEETGIKVNKIFFHNTTLKDIYDLPKAELNITDLPSPWLKQMKERSGIPYYATSSLDNSVDVEEINPHGMENSSRIFLEIADLLGKRERAVKVIEKRKREAKESLIEETRALKGTRVAVVGGFFFGMGLLLVRELGMEPAVLIYRTYGLESHGMAKSAINRIIDMDREVARQYGVEPAVLVNPGHEDEIRILKEREVELVIAPGADIFRYHREGIRAFDSMKFYLDSLRIGFECPIELARMLKKELERTPKRRPLLSMLDYDPHESTLHPSWVRLENVWRAVTDGADGGCLYG